MKALESLIERMKKEINNDNSEEAHVIADDILIEALKELSSKETSTQINELIKNYKEIYKYYI